MARSYSYISDVFLPLFPEKWTRLRAGLKFSIKKYLELFFELAFLTCHVLCYAPYRNKKYARKLLLKRGCSKFKQNRIL